MEVVVSLTGSKHLSTSAFIARSLCSTLQVGSTVVQGSPMEVEEALFKVGGGNTQLAVTIRNGQTQTVLYVRDIPLSLVAGSNRSWITWVAVYPPGDPRNLTFSESALPRPDDPQVQLSMRCVASVQVTAGLGALGEESPKPSILPRTFGQLEESPKPSTLPRSFGQLEESPKPSILPRSFGTLEESTHEQGALRRTFEQLEDIRSKFTALQDEKRQVETSEHELQEVQRQLEEARVDVEQAELELYRANTARTSAEQEKQSAVDACDSARETLRQHEQSILELRSSCEEAKHRLAEVSSECQKQQADLDCTKSNFDQEMADMAEELERWRSQAGILNDKASSNKSLDELLDRGELELDCTQVCNTQTSQDEAKFLQSELDNTSAVLSSVQKQSAEQAAALSKAESECQDAATRLAAAEAAANQAREDSRQASAEARAEVEAAEKELVAAMNKVASLEGQVSENRNQLREMGIHVDEIVTRLREHDDTLRDTGVAVVGLKGQFEMQQLDFTRRAVESQLEDVGSRIASLRHEQECLRQETVSADSEVQAEETEEREVAQSMEQEAQRMVREESRQQRQEAELANQLSNLEAELVQAREEFREVDEQAVKLKDVFDTSSMAIQDEERDLQVLLGVLRNEVEEHRREAQAADSTKEAAACQLDETQNLLPQRRAEAERLQMARHSLRLEHEQRGAETSKVLLELESQDVTVKALSAKLSEKQEHLLVAEQETRATEAREEELQQALDDTVICGSRRQEEAREQLAEADSRRADLESTLGVQRLRRSQLAAEVEQLNCACRLASDRFEEVCAQTDMAENLSLGRIRELEAYHERHQEEQGELGRQTVELEERVKALEAQLTENSVERQRTDDSLARQATRLAGATEAAANCEQELEARLKLMPVEAKAVIELQEHIPSVERRVSSLRSKLHSEEATAGRRAAAHEECAEIVAAREHWLEEVEADGQSSGILAEKNAELDQQIDRIDELEREVLALTGKVEQCVDANMQLEEQLNSAERGLLEAREKAADHRSECLLLKQELQSAEERQRQSERSIATAEGKVEAAELAVGQREAEAADEQAHLSGVLDEVRQMLGEHNKRLKAFNDEVAALEERKAQAAEQATKLREEIKAARQQCQESRDWLQQAEVRRVQEIQDIGRLTEQKRVAELKQEFSSQPGGATPRPSIGVAGLQSKGEDSEVDERKLDLIQEQITSRTGVLTKTESEGREIRAATEGLGKELQQLQEQQGALADKLSYQVELGNLQSATIQRLQDEVQRFEGEAEMFTWGLHDAEQRNEFLQKENHLMQQQLNGLYSGSLHDWAAEVDRLKADVELQVHKDELRHWMQVAEDAERELRNDVEEMRKAHEEVENSFSEKVKGLEGELAKWQEKMQDPSSQREQKSGGAVHSVPAALHGFVQPVRRPPPNTRQRALIIGCNYTKSHVPLRGCANDAWNLQCLLRHSLHYTDDGVRTLLDGSESCPAPPGRQPTKANILASLQWLVNGAGPNDSLFLYFGGYSTQQPQNNLSGNFEAFLVPCDFAADLPMDFFSRRGDPLLSPSSGSYRLLALADLSRVLMGLPAGCKVTVVFDCGLAVLPGVDAARPAPVTFPQVAIEEASDVWNDAVSSRARVLNLPLLPTAPSLPLSGPPPCRCHCYSACRSEQWCVELLIEGCVQGAFTWAFVKALTAGHLDTSVSRHSKALDRILGDLQQKFGWIDQTPVVQLSPSAKSEDLVVVTEVPIKEVPPVRGASK